MNQRVKDADTHAIHQARMKRDRELTDFEKMSVDEVFAVVTRSGAGVFLPMIENTIRRIVSEEVEKGFKLMAKGLIEGAMKQEPEVKTEERQGPTGVTEDIEYEQQVTTKGQEFCAPKSKEPSDVDKNIAENIGGILDIVLPKRRGGWTDAEREELVKTVNLALMRGETKVIAFRRHAEKHNRTESAVAWHWNNVINKKED